MPKIYLIILLFLLYFVWRNFFGYFNIIRFSEYFKDCFVNFILIFLYTTLLKSYISHWTYKIYLFFFIAEFDRSKRTDKIVDFDSLKFRVKKVYDFLPFICEFCFVLCGVCKDLWFCNSLRGFQENRCCPFFWEGWLFRLLLHLFLMRVRRRDYKFHFLHIIIIGQVQKDREVQSFFPVSKVSSLYNIDNPGDVGYTFHWIFYLFADFW